MIINNLLNRKKCALCLDPLYLKYRNVFLLTQNHSKHACPLLSNKLDDLYFPNCSGDWYLDLSLYTQPKLVKTKTSQLKVPVTTTCWKMQYC